MDSYNSDDDSFSAEENKNSTNEPKFLYDKDPPFNI